MRRLAGTVCLVLAACGGGSDGFDESGLRELIEANAQASATDADIDALVDIVRGVCDESAAEQAISIDAGDSTDGPSMRDMLEVACPDDIKVD